MSCELSITELEYFLDYKYTNMDKNKLDSGQEGSAQPTMDQFITCSTPTTSTEKKRKPNTPLSATECPIDDETDIRDLIINMQQTLTTQMEEGQRQVISLINDNKLEINYNIETLMDKTTRVQSELDLERNNMLIISNENKTLKDKQVINEGRITRLESLVDRLQEDIMKQKQRSMQNNLIIQNVPEKEGENIIDKMFDLLHKELNIGGEDMENITIYKAHRMGQKRQHSKFSRPVIINVNDQSKSIILKHTKHLKGKSYNIFVQMPHEMVERKKQLLSHYKDCRTNKIPTKWIGDKLLAEDEVIEVSHPKMGHNEGSSTDVAIDMPVHRTPITERQKSKFQGAKVCIDGINHVIPALHAVYGNPDVARATHNIYAYRCESGGKMVSYYNDDGEYGAGRRILKMMEDNDMSNRLICVSRWYGGSHMGPSRFDSIMDIAKQAIDLTIYM